MIRPLKILLTSAGSRSAEAILDCLEPVRNRIYCVGTNTVPEFVALENLDAAYLVPETFRRDDFAARIGEIAAIENPDVIINGRDEELPVLAEIFRDGPLALSLPRSEIADIYSDKYKTWLFCRDRELSFLATAFTRNEVEDLLSDGYPVVAKPRYNGHASKNVFVVFRRAELERLFATGVYVFQTFVGDDVLRESYTEMANGGALPVVWNPPNECRNIDVVMDSAGKEVGRCITKGLRAGSTVQNSRLTEESALNEVAESCVVALGEAGHRGPLNIQGYMTDTGAFAAFEWNARFIGSVYGFSLLGRNLVLDWLESHHPGLRLACPAIEPLDFIFRPMRYRAVHAERVRQLRQKKHWVAAPRPTF